MNNGTLIGHFRLDGVEMCNENWLHQDEEGLFITISFYPEAQPEDERQKWVVRPGGVAQWADENPKWFEIICRGGLQMSLGDELMDVEEDEDEAFKKAKDGLFDEFVKAATDSGLWFNGMGTMSVKIGSPEPVEDSVVPSRPPLWKRILGLA